MSDSPRVSVVVPVRNAENTIADCLESILKLEYPAAAFEVVVAENASTDRTMTVLERYSHRVRIVHEPRRGSSAARNAGVRQARGALVAFTDADCTVHPAWLAKLVPQLADASVGLVGGSVLAQRPCNRVERYGEVIHDHERAITGTDPPYVLGGNCAARRETLQTVGGFDPAYPRSQDSDLSFRLHRAGYRLVFERDAIAYHRNESTLPGLFREGFQHGFWSVRLFKAHRPLLNGRPLVSMRPYRELARKLARSVRGPERFEATCASAFLAGKRAGKIVGSVRFRSPQL